jgi:hypothetical protein
VYENQFQGAIRPKEETDTPRSAQSVTYGRFTNRGITMSNRQSSGSCDYIRRRGLILWSVKRELIQVRMYLDYLKTSSKSSCTFLVLTVPGTVIEPHIPLWICA